MTNPALHLVTVWNPTYAADAMDAHLRLLLDWSERWRKGEADRDDVYVWWGKLRSASRNRPLPHLAEILALQEQIADGVETHLYLTDFRSLYVAELIEVTDDAITDASDEWDHVPAYYQKHSAELWFGLNDIRRLVSDDTVGVIDELRHLRNTRFHDRPVSLYGGMVDVPLIVRRESDARWFADADALIDGRLWAERDNELRGTVERLARELRDDLFGADVWSTFEPSTRSFIASGEAIYRTRRDDPAFDFATVLVEYAKALETELNALFFPALQRVLAREPTSLRWVNLDGRTLDLGAPVAHQTLGALLHLLEKNDVFQRGVRLALRGDARWALDELPAALAPIVDVRNPGAHSRTCTRDDVQPLRSRVLGIGGEGVLVRIARVRNRLA